MRKPLIIISSVLAFIALAVSLPGFVNGYPPHGEIHLLEDGKVELINTGNVPLFYSGYGKGSCVMSARFADPGKKMPNLFMCGTGLMALQLDPGKSIIVSPYLQDEARTGDEIFWQVSICGDTSGWRKCRFYATEKIPLLDKVLPGGPEGRFTDLRSKKFIPQMKAPVAVTGNLFE